MIHKRETQEDLRRQERLLLRFSEKLKVKFSQFSSFSKKYRIDGFLYKEGTNEVKAWVECKWYSAKAHCFLNVPKFNELKALSESTKSPSYLLFREFDRWGYICLHDGEKIACEYKTVLKGGTQKGRAPNPDDIEPLIVLSRENIIWGN